MEGGTSPIRSANRRRILLVALAVLVALAWFLPAGVRPLTRTDEGRYAEIPREMFRSGDWVTPRLNGFLYFEKPPLQYWATATAYTVFGLNEFAARFWTALTGLLGILVTGWCGRRLFGRDAGTAGALLLLMCPWWLGLSRINTLDMGVTFFLTVALAGFCLGQANRDDPRKNRVFMLLCWAGMALAVMSKGLMGIVLPGGALVVYSIVQRDLEVWKRLHVGKGLVLFLAITVPWFVLVSKRHPVFPEFFFIHEHFERFLTKGHDRYKPPYFFLPVLVGGVLPWIVLAGRAAARGWRRERPRGTFDARRMIWIWTAFVFLFFSASSSKLLGYIGPCFPGLALLAGPAAARAGRKTLRSTAGITLGAGVAALAAAPFLPMFRVSDTTPEMLRGAILYFVLGGLVLAGAGWLAWRDAADDPVRTLGKAAAGWLVGVSVILTATTAIEPANSSRSLAQEILPHLDEDVPFYSVDRYDQSLPFYLDRTMILVKRRGELVFGIEQQPSMWVPTIAEFRERWRAHDKAVAVVNGEQVAIEEEKGLPFRVIWPEGDPGENRRAVLAR